MFGRKRDSAASQEPRRPDPEALLRQVQAEERQARRGRLKIFLGYSSGVGKTFTMLDEGRRRRERGEDVVVGAVQAKRPPEVEPLLAALEMVPARERDGIQVIDVDAILRRRPRVCLVDGLACDNPPGSRNPHRWRDVEDLLRAGISVITTINLQYITEYRDQVERITGKRAASAVPLSFLHGADEIALVDAPADQSGSPDAVRGISELRELALLAAADVVERQLEGYLERHGIAQQWGAQERILVCVTPRSDASAMIASGRRNRERFHGELFVVYVQQPELTPEDQAALDRNLELAGSAGAQVELLTGEDPIRAILDFANARRITQIFIGHSERRGWWHRLLGGPVDRLIRLAEGIDVQVFPH